VEGMLGLHVEAVDVVEPAVPGFRDDRKGPPVAGGIGLAMRDAPLDDCVSYYTDAVRVGDHHRAFEEPGLFDPGGAGHFAIAVERPPAGENGIAHGIFAAWENGGDAGAHGAFTDLKLSFPGDERRVADGDAGNVGDGVEWTGRAVEGDAEIAGAGLSSWFVLWIADAIKDVRQIESNTPRRPARMILVLQD